MKELVINIVSDDMAEIVVPSGHNGRLRCSVVCLCCERPDQPMATMAAAFAMRASACLFAQWMPWTVLNYRRPSPLYRSLPVIDDCLQRWNSVARQPELGNVARQSSRPKIWGKGKGPSAFGDRLLKLRRHWGIDLRGVDRPGKVPIAARAPTIHLFMISPYDGRFCDQPVLLVFVQPAENGLAL